jgi:hypothetical protein
MSVKLTAATGEAAAFTAAFPQLEDGVDVRQLAPWPYPPLTLGTVRALLELAADFQVIFEEYTPEEVARALSR